MSLRLLVDEDTQAKELVKRLLDAGQDVLTVEAANLGTALDEIILEYARRDDRILLTRNCSDFLALHDTDPGHAGILAIYQDQDPSKNMRYEDIIKAISNIEASGLDVAGQFFALNAWVY